MAENSEEWDKQLSEVDKKVIYILTLPNADEFSPNEIAQVGKLTENEVIASLEKLERLGHISHE